MTTMFHGAHGGNGLWRGTAHVGMCWTTSRRSAEVYAGNGRKATVWCAALDLDALTTLDVDGYDADADTAAGDTVASLESLRADGIDAIIYSDADETGRVHDTIRLISDRAVAIVAAAMGQIEAE